MRQSNARLRACKFNDRIILARIYRAEQTIVFKGEERESSGRDTDL
jgi:hypothetical protein